MTSSLVKAAPPSEGLKHPQNGAAVCYLEDPPGVGSTRGEGTLGCRGLERRRSVPRSSPCANSTVGKGYVLDGSVSRGPLNASVFELRIAGSTAYSSQSVSIVGLA